MRGIFERPPGTGVWWISYFDSAGKWHREKVGRRSAAITAYHARKREIREGLFIKPMDRRAKMSFVELTELAIEAKRGRNARLSLRSDGYRKGKLLAAFGTTPAVTIDASMIETFLKGILATGCSGTTVNRYRSLLSSIFSYGVRTGKVPGNPVAGVPRYKENNQRVRFLSHEEEKKLRRCIRKYDRRREAEFDLALNTGMRRGEQFNLTWENVDLERGILTVSGKTGQRFIPINGVASAALRKLRRGSSGVYVCPETKYEGQADWRRWFEASVQRAGIPNLTWHDLRHTFASRLVMAGVDLRTVQELLGHKTISMTIRYSHLSPSHLRSAVDVLSRPLEASRSDAAKTHVVTHTRTNTSHPKRLATNKLSAVG